MCSARYKIKHNSTLLSGLTWGAAVRANITTASAQHLSSGLGKSQSGTDAIEQLAKQQRTTATRQHGPAAARVRCRFHPVKTGRVAVKQREQKSVLSTAALVTLALVTDEISDEPLPTSHSRGRTTMHEHKHTLGVQVRHDSSLNVLKTSKGTLPRLQTVLGDWQSFAVFGR